MAMIRRLVATATVLGTVAALVALPARPAVAFAPPPAFATSWGSMGSADGQFKYPWGVAVDSAGNVYVADRDNHRIQKFTAAGVYLAQWGSYGTGAGQFANPYGLAIDADDNVFVVDTSNHRVQKFTSTGQYLTQWGSYGYRDGWFQYPQGVAVDSAGDVYVTDGEGRRVQKFTSTGQYLIQWGTAGTGNGQFNYPRAVAVDADDNVYVADTNNHRVQKFTTSGTYLSQWGGFGAAPGQFNAPFALDVHGDDVFVADYNNHRVQVFGTDGSFRSEWGGEGDASGRFRNPQGLVVDEDGTVYVSDAENHRVQVFEPAPAGVAGTVTDAVSGAPVSGAWLVVLRAADFSIAGSAASDAAGRFLAVVPPGAYFLYVVDPSGEHRSGFHGAPALLSVAAGSTIDADPALAPTRGTVMGRVRVAGTSAPIEGAWALAFSGATGALETAAVASGAGDYTLPGLAPGAHYVGWVDPSGAHAARFSPDVISLPASTPLAVTAGGVTMVDGSLPAQSLTGTGSVLSGRVTEAGTGRALAGVHVVALHAGDYRMARGAVTDGNGDYAFDLAAGSYHLAFADSSGTHHMEWYDDQPPTGLATASPVTAPGTADVALGRSTGTLVGTVTDGATGGPLMGVGVLVLGPTGMAGGVATEPDGTYRIDDLAPGTYRVAFADGVGGRRQEYWNDSSDFAGATPFAVTAGATVTRDAALAHP